jgi:predicted transcriptional regulator
MFQQISGILPDRRGMTENTGDLRWEIAAALVREEVSADIIAKCCGVPEDAVNNLAYNRSVVLMFLASASDGFEEGWAESKLQILKRLKGKFDKKECRKAIEAIYRARVEVMEKASIRRSAAWLLGEGESIRNVAEATGLHADVLQEIKAEMLEKETTAASLIREGLSAEEIAKRLHVPYNMVRRIADNIIP